MTRDTDSRGVTALRTLDVLDRVIFVDYPEDELDISYIYDDPAVLFSKGRLTAITRDGESIDYRYDRFGRRAQDGALSYNYDRNGNRRTVAYPGGVVATYTYDYADRQSSLAIQKDADPAQAIVAAASYEPFGPLSSLALGNGLSEIRRFNARYLLSEIEMADVLNWSYATDAMGNVLAITDQNDPAPSRVYGYQDYQYYLTSGVGPWGALGWTYDRLGNRLTETRDGATTSYIYTSNVAGNSSPILKSTLADGPNDSPTRYGYDASGSLTQESRTDSRIRYRYNSAKRLSEILRDSANQAPSKTQIRYDGRSFLNDSTLKQFPGSQTREWSTRATYTSDGVLHHRSIERHATPASPRGSPTTRGDDYIFYFAGRPVAQLGFRTMTLVTQTDTTESLLYLTTDHLGTPILATAEARNVEWGGGLEPFGADYSGAAEAGIFLRFPGQWEDSTWENSSSDAGAPYNIFRWYRNNLGSYTRPDPMGLDAGENLYLYTLARPTVLYDTDGRIPFAVAVVVVDLGIISSAYAGCALVQFENANRIGNSQGWRYAHCMAACWLRKTCGLSKKVAGGFGYLNEIKQSYECKRAVVIDGSLSEDVPACRSAFAPVDLDEDNPLGFNCPDDVRCETNCESLKGKSKKRDQFGPYYHWAP